MDKKRREKTSFTTNITNKVKKHFLYSISELVATQEQCGIVSKKFRFLENYGTGYFEFHRFDGLYINIFDVLLKQDITIDGHLSKDYLELSFLIEGEQIIRINGIATDLICESQECYMVYLHEIQGSVVYLKRKRVKEIKIRMSSDFITRHRINEEYDISERYSLRKLQDSFLLPLCTKTQGILSEILSDNRKGLLKRLFLESKTLELITLQLDKSSKAKPMITQVDHTVKKLYQAQYYISSDLSVQYSIQELSRKIGLNDFVFKKEFKNLFGKTVFEYATESRMNRAKQLLLHSKKPIYEISELVGYKNSTHFTAAFKKIEGITPRKYRDSGIEEIA